MSSLYIRRKGQYINAQGQIWRCIGKHARTDGISAISGCLSHLRIQVFNSYCFLLRVVANRRRQYGS
jgi:hypothetical protein